MSPIYFMWGFAWIIWHLVTLSSFWKERPTLDTKHFKYSPGTNIGFPHRKNFNSSPFLRSGWRDKLVRLFSPLFHWKYFICGLKNNILKTLCLHAGPYLPILTIREKYWLPAPRKIQNGANKTRTLDVAAATKTTSSDLWLARQEKPDKFDSTSTMTCCVGEQYPRQSKS